VCSLMINSVRRQRRLAARSSAAPKGAGGTVREDNPSDTIDARTAVATTTAAPRRSPVVVKHPRALVVLYRGCLAGERRPCRRWLSRSRGGAAGRTLVGAVSYVASAGRAEHRVPLQLSFQETTGATRACRSDLPIGMLNDTTHARCTRTSCYRPDMERPVKSAESSNNFESSVEGGRGGYRDG
jgi:hypothetical protein